MAAIAGYKGVVKGQTGVAAAFTDKACTEISVDHTQYQITDASLRFWEYGGAIVVEVDAGGGFATVPASDYTVQPLGGVITFNDPLGATDDVQVSGNAYPMAAFAQFRSWAGDVEVDMLETTVLGGGGNKEFIPGVMSGTFSVEGFWVNSYFITKLKDRAICALDFYVDANGGHYMAYAYADKLGITDEPGATVDESVDFQVSGGIAYYSS